MAPPGYNEADTRAKLIDPALHNARWVERVPEAERDAHGEIQREQSAVRIDILDGKPLKRGRGRVDYLLRAHVGGHEHPLTLAFVDAQRERALALREEAKVLRKADRDAEVERVLTDAVGAERAARDALAKAQAIEDAVYDLKAVNPAEKKVADTRTPAELLQAIADKGKEVDDALERLKELMK